MSNGFVHSVKVPRLYKTAAKIIQDVQENSASLKTLVFSEKHPNISGLYALTLNTLQKTDQLNQLIRDTKILINEPRFNPWLARVLITELLWGKQRLTGGSKPIDTILNYETSLRNGLKNINIPDMGIAKKRVLKPRYARVNTLLISVEDAISNFQNEGWSILLNYTDYSSYLKLLSNLSEPYFTQDYHIPELLVFPSGTSFFKNSNYKIGNIILQDKASCLPSYLLNPPIGSSVLDMCAAPGMKTSHLAAILQNKGNIYAVELEEKRFQTLCEQLAITNSFCVKTINNDAMNLSEKECPNVEYILVDPTCSGSGMINRPIIGKKDGQYESTRLKSLQSFQVFLLQHALLNFPTVKKVIYSTCSINREENEDVIDEVLSKIGNAYKLVSIKKLLKNDWINYSSENSDCKKKCIYARPEVDMCNGFFVALFKRNFDVPLPAYTHRRYFSEEMKSRNMSEEQKNKKQEMNADLDLDNTLPKKKKKRKNKKRVESDTKTSSLDEKNAVIVLKQSSKRKDKSIPNEISKKKLKIIECNEMGIGI